jgi:hypothetical protein
VRRILHVLGLEKFESRTVHPLCRNGRISLPPFLNRPTQGFRRFTQLLPVRSGFLSFLHEGQRDFSMSDKFLWLPCRSVALRLLCVHDGFAYQLVGAISRVTGCRGRG